MRLEQQPASATSSIRIRPTTVGMGEIADPSQYSLPANPANLLRADPARRAAVSFRGDGVTLAGHLYRPPTVAVGEPTPGVVMCGPISSVKEQTLPHYAERFSAAGYTVLTFDPRNFGESEGAPRFRYDPNQVIADYSCAVSYLITRSDIDPENVAAVGVCMGGGYAVSLGARDKRLKAVVSIAGGYDIGGTFQQFLGVEGFAAYLRQVNDLVQRQYETGEIAYIPTIAEALTDRVPVAVMPNPEAFSYYDRTGRDEAPNWSRTLTADSLESYFGYNSVIHAPLVAPTPLQIIHGTTDTALLPEHAQRVYDAAQGAKELVWLDTHNHIELYDQDPYVSAAAGHALRWLDRYLGAESPVQEQDLRL
ncbi:alpha/beta hydrolase [Nocardia stercoris]|uniref:Alpha/beta hydrolase n=1 Tax=Nocardia stercoris TaxID=2483361 RepID=A0A3M2KTC9_9NOCA|nr:alpha/beta hydrolase [Nocardia stercoris]RMI28902.1 alpha/beta hydrolase [Nocardia stercoris]